MAGRASVSSICSLVSAAQRSARCTPPMSEPATRGVGRRAQHWPWLERRLQSFPGSPAQAHLPPSQNQRSRKGDIRAWCTAQVIWVMRVIRVRSVDRGDVRRPAKPGCCTCRNDRAIGYTAIPSSLHQAHRSASTAAVHLAANKKLCTYSGQSIGLRCRVRCSLVDHCSESLRR
jgi:hypothetical protein